MRIYVTTQPMTGHATAVVEHRGQELQWNISAYAKTSERASAVDINHMFDEINSYWLTVDPSVTDAIWVIYKQIRMEMDSITEFHIANKKLRDLIGRLYQHIDFDSILHWMLYHSNVRIPGGLKDHYEPNDPRDRTYLKTDYHKLAAFAIVLRPLVPIWGEYIVTTKQDAGATWKEYIALSLIYNTYLNDCEPMVKLRAFVQNTLDSNMQAGSTTTAVMSGLSTSEIPQWVLATTIVRRLAVGEVSAPSDTSTVITNTYNYINNTWRSGDRKLGKKYGGKVSEKKQYTDGADEDKTSHIENYKVKQQVADGDLVILNVYTERVYDMANHIDPTIPIEYINACLNASSALSNQQIATALVPLTQWTLSKCLPARGIPLLSKPAMLRAMSIAQAALWHWGFFDLAALITSTEIRVSDDIHISSTESRNRISKELQAKLDQLYPYSRPSRSKQESARKLNVAFRAIDELCENISFNDWHLHAPDALIEKTSKEGFGKRMSVPVDIRTQLAELIIRLYNNQGNFA